MMEIAKLYVPVIWWEMGHGSHIYCGEKNNNCNKLGMKVQRTGKLLCDVVCYVKASDMEIVQIIVMITFYC